MTTINLVKTDPVVDSATSITATATSPSPTISAYGITNWFEVGRIEWTAIYNDVVTCNGFVTTTVSSVTCTGIEQLAGWFRARLFNVTTGYDVWAGTTTQMIYRRIGANDYNTLRAQSSIGGTYYTGMPGGMLIPGNAYRWYIEVMKESVVGTPTLTLTVDDSAVYADAARLNP